MYDLNGFTLDGPQAQPSIALFLSLMWGCKLQQLTVTHSMLPEAGMQAAEVVVCDTSSTATHKVGQCRS